VALNSLPVRTSVMLSLGHPRVLETQRASWSLLRPRLPCLDSADSGSLLASLEKGLLMTIIKINAITVPAGGGDELAHRFAARAGAVDDQAGFEGFELLKPIDDRDTWLVITRWADDESFQAWVSSPAFGHGHRSDATPADKPAAPKVGMSSELWSYEIAGGSSR
jgi:heme-degrading monooxygenase HmoA